MEGCNIYLELVMVAAIAIFIVDLSGFTDTLLGLLSRLKGRRVESFKPFTCSLCMTWWCCLIWAIIQHQFTLPVIAVCAGLAAFSFPMGQVFIFIREGLNKIIASVEKLLGI